MLYFIVYCFVNIFNSVINYSKAKMSKILFIRELYVFYLFYIDHFAHQISIFFVKWHITFRLKIIFQPAPPKGGDAAKAISKSFISRRQKPVLNHQLYHLCFQALQINEPFRDLSLPLLIAHHLTGDALRLPDAKRRF